MKKLKPRQNNKSNKKDKKVMNQKMSLRINMTV